MIRTSTNKVVKPKAPSSTLDIQYPRAFFVKVGGKPPLNITLTCDSLSAAGPIVRSHIRNSTLELDHARTFLYYFGLTIESELEEDWDSYEVKIGSAGDKLTPWSLYNVTATVVRKDSRAESPGMWTDVQVALYILSVYRMIRTANQDHKNIVMRRLTDQIANLGQDPMSVDETFNTYSGWVGDRTFNKLVAGIDMYFMKFPEHPYSPLRIGTIGSRYRDCTALLSYGFLMRQMGTSDLSTIQDWIFVESIGDDIDRMMVENEELEGVHSYFPYQIDMGLVHRSAFSTVANPHFFLFAHAIGTLFLTERSINAIYTFEGNSGTILLNSAIVAYVFSRNHDFTKVYHGEHDDPSAREEAEHEADDPDLLDEEFIFKSSEAMVWLSYLSSNGGTCPKPVHRFYKECIKKLSNVRAGTIGEFLQKDPLHSDF